MDRRPLGTRKCASTVFLKVAGPTEATVFIPLKLLHFSEWPFTAVLLILYRNDRLSKIEIVPGYDN